MRHFLKTIQKWTLFTRFSFLLGGGAGLGVVLPAVAEEKEPEKAEAAGEKAKPEIRKVSEDEFEMGKIRFNKKTREIRFPAKLNLDSETILEFAVVNSQIGKLHESLLATDVRPFELQIVMKLLKYVPSARSVWPEYDKDGMPLPMKTDKLGGVTISVAWRDAKGAAKSGPIEDWILNAEEKKAMAKDAWIYTGSEVVDGNYLPELEGSIMAVYRSGGAMFNAFLKGSDNDEVWFPRKEHLPPLGTPVEVAIRPREIVK